MSDNSEEKSEFKVVDKRRFTDEGEKKDDAPEEPRKEQPAAATEQPSPGAGEAPAVDFSSFVVSLATQALALLGEIEHPEIQGVAVNLDAAKQLIDILGVLEEKTKGNLSAEEEKLLGDILASVRMAYVGKAKG